MEGDKEMNGLPEFLEGATCATCKLLIPVYCHPWNEDIGKGKMSEQLGFVCTLFENNFSFCEASTIERSVCECHTPKGKDSVYRKKC